ncbi:Alpha/beta hydrolase family protein [Planctomycetes bacterium Poly30]|uniref:Alpha/beta hydrolase family protein n=1 Tax=Saltatorellus ferox TaxID=2528018 RepID=A0A518EPT3_9BACT|nr:Alpha/beta hydrolase family protein [Planctomycetes bacterium Poly30]
MFSRFLLALLLLSSSGFGQKIGEVQRVAPSDAASVGEVLEWTSEQGQEYWYRLPQKQRGRRKPALVFMLHGTGLNHGWSFWNYPIAKGTFRGEDIVVSPDGLTPGSGDTFNFVQNKTDEEQIVGLIELFRSRFDIGNVYLYGHSQGAFFCYWFAGEHPELVDGIVAHAGNVLNVQHPKIAKEKVAIGILHARSDQVVPVSCAERTETIYRDQGYQKVKCWIVEGIRDQAGHWPLPTHVATMFEWLDEVATFHPVQAVEVARGALADKEPNFSVAIRAAGDAREGLKKYRGDDKAVALAMLDEIDGALARCAEAAAAALVPVFEAAGKGKEPGPWAADVRWCRQAFARSDAFARGTKSFASTFKSHDKAIAALARIKDPESKKYAKAALNALRDGFVGEGWEALALDLKGRIEGGWAPIDGLEDDVDAAISSASLDDEKDRTDALTSALAEALEACKGDYPAVFAPE